jgi:hypothetical protein
MTARTAQSGIAAIFLILGAWCLLGPQSVLDLGVQPEFRSNAAIASVFVACFGAQAMIAGLFAATAIFTRLTFLLYGIALLPFFVFDYWYYAVVPMFNDLILVDAAGNAIMLALCWIGWRRAEI